MPDVPPDHLAPAPVTSPPVPLPVPPSLPPADRTGDSPDDVRTLREEHRVMIGLLREIAESSLVSYLREIGRSHLPLPVLGAVRVDVVAALAVLLLVVLYLLPADLRGPVVQRAIDYLVPPPGL